MMYVDKGCCWDTLKDNLKKSIKPRPPHSHQNTCLANAVVRKFRKLGRTRTISVKVPMIYFTFQRYSHIEQQSGTQTFHELCCKTINGTRFQ